jgi:hypothetical protein
LGVFRGAVCRGWKNRHEQRVSLADVLRFILHVLIGPFRPGTALLFALTIVEIFAGKEKRDEVAGPMIVAEAL